MILHSSYAVTHRRPSRKPVTLAPRSPSAPPSCAVWAVLAAGWVLSLPAVSAPCAGAVAAFWAVNPSSMRRLCSVNTVCSTKVLNCSSVSGMVPGSSFSINPMRLQRRFVLSLRSCSFCSWISRFFLLVRKKSKISNSSLTTALESVISLQEKSIYDLLFLAHKFLALLQAVRLTLDVDNGTVIVHLLWRILASRRKPSLFWRPMAGWKFQTSGRAITQCRRNIFLFGRLWLKKRGEPYNRRMWKYPSKLIFECFTIESCRYPSYNPLYLQWDRLSGTWGAILTGRTYGEETVGNSGPLQYFFNVGSCAVCVVCIFGRFGEPAGLDAAGDFRHLYAVHDSVLRRLSGQRFPGKILVHKKAVTECCGFAGSRIYDCGVLACSWGCFTGVWRAVRLRCWHNV